MLSLVPVLAMGMGACQVVVDYGDTSFACSTGECPSGYTCEQELCVSDEGVPGEPDAAVSVASPDAGASAPDAQALAACDDAFAMAPGYQLCSEDEASCSFNVNTAGGTCAQACEQLGSTCLEAFANNDGDLCLPLVENGDTCESTRQTEICVCARLQL